MVILREGSSILTEPFHWSMSDSDGPTDLAPVDPVLIDLQDEVREFFDWDLRDDVDSAQLLIARVEESEIESWARHNRLATIAHLFRRLVIREPEVAVLGSAIEPEDLTPILERPVLLVAADGASAVLSELPDSLSEKAWSRLVCVVSDADGGDGTEQAVRRSVPFILHAHGDNEQEWSALLDIAEISANPPSLILTHQTPTGIEGMYNPGGFTDGDRAVCFLRALGVRMDRILVMGTRTDYVGRWSGFTQEQTKLQKLRWMARFLDILGIEL
ncbi:MAG: hypothetical protein CMA54_03725 [Euryarchaeota archaeon]|jgi:uncharacterized Rossmann fold enzyme|nr:hypothetical protein [Euryarchaeota archaeon]MBV43870.1 hypothetical protein [Euryarchaeota archaeon]|tara:strand:+ start:4739 stop:5557 length:819 start_codon:yes stop_codon:yes gene_type:complete